MNSAFRSTAPPPYVRTRTYVHTHVYVGITHMAFVHACTARFTAHAVARRDKHDWSVGAGLTSPPSRDCRLHSHVDTSSLHLSTSFLNSSPSRRPLFIAITATSLHQHHGDLLLIAVTATLATLVIQMLLNAMGIPRCRMASSCICHKRTEFPIQ